MLTLRGSSRFRAGSTQSEIFKTDRGSAIVETALMLPVLISFASVLLTAIAVGSTAIHLGDTAHDLARALARGVPEAEVMTTAAQVAPSAKVEVKANGGFVEVTVTQEIDIPVPLLDRFSFTIDRSAAVPQEST